MEIFVVFFISCNKAEIHFNLPTSFPNTHFNCTIKTSAPRSRRTILNLFILIYICWSFYLFPQLAICFLWASNTEKRAVYKHMNHSASGNFFGPDFVFFLTFLEYPFGFLGTFCLGWPVISREIAWGAPWRWCSQFLRKTNHTNPTHPIPSHKVRFPTSDSA